MTSDPLVKQQDESLPAYTVEVRMLLLIQWLTKGRNDWKQVEEATGIKAVKWRHYHSGVIRPSLEMFEALCKLFPEHAFWLSTGLTDYEAGHTAPQANVAFPGSFGTFFPSETPYSAEYFRICAAALEAVMRAFVTDLNDRRGSDEALTRNHLVNLFKIGINFSIQLGSTEVAGAMSKKEHRDLTERIFSARKHHVEAMLERLRDIDYVDAVIDQQRSHDREMEKKFTKGKQKT